MTDVSPLYYVQSGSDTPETRLAAEIRLRGMGCTYARHEERPGGTMCSLGYTSPVPDGIYCGPGNPRTPVFAE